MITCGDSNERLGAIDDDNGTVLYEPDAISVVRGGSNNAGEVGLL
jgi:hypothetical protein